MRSAKAGKIGSGGRRICGVDEAGRGPLAGPVVAAAVILSPKKKIDGLTDSKLLSPAKRLCLFLEILHKADCWQVSAVSCEVIDKVNVLRASLLAMRDAVVRLDIRPDIVYVDGNFLIPDLDIAQEAVINGDLTVPQISAASIVAKVTRDMYMYQMSKIYTGYGFEQHKGYCTEEHLKILDQLGPCEIHRRSFSPVSQISMWQGHNRDS